MLKKTQTTTRVTGEYSNEQKAEYTEPKLNILGKAEELTRANEQGPACDFLGPNRGEDPCS